ncbi:MAG: M48 family metallopeptidase, partial [Acetatifactor sp.]|nr:M48 family metallopeptidase [Acetatifactor sp.]
MSHITNSYPPETIKRMEVMDRRYRKAAREYFAGRCEYYRQFTGGSYTRITIRDQRTRFVICYSNGTLSFNYLLIFAPPRVLD